MNSVIIIIIILIVLLSIYFILNIFTKEKATFNDNILYIGSECMGIWGNNYILYLLKLVYPNKTIKFENNSNVKLIVKSHFCSQENTWNNNKNIPYIYFNGESYQVKDSFENPNSIILSDLIIDNPPDNYYYIPYYVFANTYKQFLERMNKTDFNINRKFLAYCNSNCVEIRENLVTLIAEYDNTNDVYAIGNCKGKSDKINIINVENKDHSYNYKIYEDYNFVIAMENSDLNGYVTEKIMNVFLAGSIPIYWGTKYIKEIFNEKAFIYVNDFSSLEECAKYIIELNNDKNRLLNMLKEPIFKNNKVPEYYIAEPDKPSMFNLNLANKIKNLIDKN
jgi:hypothetical protein